MAYQTPDSKKEEFRKYLEKSGVIDALTKVLVGLYEEPERPPNAVDYVKRYLGAPTGVDVEAIRAENDTLKKENAELKTTIEELNARVSDCRGRVHARALMLLQQLLLRWEWRCWRRWSSHMAGPWRLQSTPALAPPPLPPLLPRRCRDSCDER